MSRPSSFLASTRSACGRRLPPRLNMKGGNLGVQRRLCKGNQWLVGKRRGRRLPPRLKVKGGNLTFQTTATARPAQIKSPMHFHSLCGVPDVLARVAQQQHLQIL